MITQKQAKNVDKWSELKYWLEDIFKKLSKDPVVYDRGGGYIYYEILRKMKELEERDDPETIIK